MHNNLNCLWQSISDDRVAKKSCIFRRELFTWGLVNFMQSHQHPCVLILWARGNIKGQLWSEKVPGKIPSFKATKNSFNKKMVFWEKEKENSMACKLLQKNQNTVLQNVKLQQELTLAGEHSVGPCLIESMTVTILSRLWRPLWSLWGSLPAPEAWRAILAGALLLEGLT